MHKREQDLEWESVFLKGSESVNKRDGEVMTVREPTTNTHMFLLRYLTAAQSVSGGCREGCVSEDKELYRRCRGRTQCDGSKVDEKLVETSPPVLEVEGQDCWVLVPENEACRRRREW
ncbi:hypothetical protein L2E82_49013 [Cichorium intybus]|uniref:Uncharacterized protein n=1 Tax=Cichorium intybus TaxID=13427 RepID=A0ACB8Z3G9_CICIN|nr:hypothetical protein L2E82_49013 [Cichorium intybus]